jgi:outer membrane receptor protein involved in Fe transport
MTVSAWAEPAPVVLDAMVVTATRAPQAAETVPLTVDVWTASQLADAPALTLDETLRRSAAFSLFRRSGSLTANPTAQGVSLRGIGPSGASRALVLLDGVPVNDPFGGWVAWSKLPVASLERVEIVRGGGAAAWGGASLGGVVQLVSVSPLEGAEGGRVAAMAGDFRTREVSVSASAVDDSGRDAVTVDAAGFATDGVHLVRDPGAVDISADSEHTRGQLAWAHRVSETAVLTTTLRAWREERGNGTSYQQNGAEDFFASATLAGSPREGPAWSVTIYGQEQDFRSTFSAINAARTVETPASDQYAVPARAAGAAALATWGDAAELADGAGAVTTLGLDTRIVEGETREYFFYNGTEFTRERRAGGEQAVAGVFASHARALAPGLTATLGARADATRREGGFRREVTRATGAVLVDEAYADREDNAFSPSAGLAWRATETVTLRAAAYAAYRTPTLNELYRPFRIGAITTQANAGLEPETLRGGELGAAWPAKDARSGLRATVFQNELEDAVANVTVNATTRQRRNLDATRVRGLELGGFWQVAPALRIDADYLLSDARVREGGPGAGALDGLRLAQVPRHTLSVGADWQVMRALELDMRARWVSAQFEDDLNTLALGSALRVDLAAHYAFSSRVRLTLAVENLFDTEVETGRTAAGVVSVAPPRWARAELSYAW